jgi:DNA-binding MarR family transcriptional regulator
MTRQPLLDELLAAREELADLLVAQRLHALSRSHLTAQQVRVLAVLQLSGDVPAGEVARLLGVTAATTTGIVDGLVTLGLVTRRADTDDRRVRLLSITPHGGEVLRDTVVLPDSSGNELLERLTSDELAGLLAGVRGMMRVAREGC